jgi:hypothetical protein
MMNQRQNTPPCDEKVPEGWALPELEGLITIRDKCVCADFHNQAPPTPLVATLKVLKQLNAGQYFEGFYPKMPIHLLTHLHEENWKWHVLEENTQGIVLKIYRESTIS